MDTPTEGRPLSPLDPTLEDICRTRVAIRKRVPMYARNLWAKCLLKAIREVLRHNDLRAWTDLLGLAKLVLKSEAKSSK